MLDNFLTDDEETSSNRGAQQVLIIPWTKYSSDEEFLKETERKKLFLKIRKR